MPVNSASWPPLRDVIAEFGLRANKSLGQHFLLDPHLLDRICREAGDLTGRHVIEIGPGPGGLTRALLASNAASVTAIELDPRAVRIIESMEAQTYGRLKLLAADAMVVDLPALAPSPRAIVANLPYNVGTPLLVRWLAQAAAYESMTLMFQLEVAERIMASPDTPAYGRLSVLAQWLCSGEIAMCIPAAAFSPPPKVDSALIRLRPKPQQPSPALFKAMETVTATAFGQRRKMLRGSMKPLGGEALLRQVDIDPQKRAETLSVAEFERLALAIL